MNKKIKKLVILGAVTIMTASNVAFSNALEVKKDDSMKVRKKICICINGKKYIFNLGSFCAVKPPIKNDEDKIPSSDKDENNNNGESDGNGNINDNNNNESEKDDTANDNNNKDFTSEQLEILELVNKERAKNGLKSLTLNKELSNVATIKSQDMINKGYFSHTSPTYGSPFDMMKSFGIKYKAAGENIAKGQNTPTEVMSSWMNSSGHRANILNSTFTELGIGIAKDSKGTIYWTQMFIGK